MNKYFKIREFVLIVLFLLVNVVCAKSQTQRARSAKNEISKSIVSSDDQYKNSQSRRKDIIGTVTDEKGDAIIGASVAVRGTNIGSISDLDGKFLLRNVPENGVVIVSFVSSNL